MKRLLAVSIFVGSLFLGLSRASADTLTYDFTGNCLDCSNPQGVLVLQNYTFGDPLQASELVSFTYTSSLADVSVTQANLSSLTGSLGSTPGSYDFEAVFSTEAGIFTFDTATDGTWVYGPDCVGDSCGGGTIGIDHGTDGTFSPATATAPEPSTLLLFGSGLTTLAALRRRGSRVPHE
jgi:hypothetical protein